MTTRLDWFREFSPTKRTVHGVGEALLLDGEGTVEIAFPGSEDTLTLGKTVLASSSKLTNTLSMSALASDDMCGKLDGDTITLRSKETKRAACDCCPKKSGLYHIQGITHTPPQLAPAESEKRKAEVDGDIVQQAKERSKKIIAGLNELSAPVRFWISLNLWFWGT
jgi:hypothetical protein